MVGLLAMFAIGLYVDAGRLLTLNNLFRVAQSAAITAIVGYGMALLMVTAEFDLSVGSLFAVSGALAAILLSGMGYGPVLSVVIVLTFAVLFGVTQGILVTKLGLPSLIVTIGTLTLLRGTHLLLLGGTTLTKHPDDGGWVMEALGGSIDLPEGMVVTYQLPVIHDSTHTWDQFPVQVVWIFVMLAVFHYVLFHTKFGYHLRATGDNIQSVKTTGVDPHVIKILGFGVTALVAAFAGISQFARVNSVSGGTGAGLELIVIAAVVLGGTKLTGGEGSMVGVLLGALILSLAQNILTIAGFGTGGWQQLITGLFIIGAIGLDTVFKQFEFDLVRRLYTRPLAKIGRSPRGYFAGTGRQKTTDDMIGFLVMTIGATIALLALGTVVLGLAGAVGADFKLLVGQGLLPAAILTYLIVLLLALLGIVTLEVTTRYAGRDGDYETSIGIVCYGMAPFVALAVPLVLLGFDVVLVGTALFTALLLSVPIVAVAGWLIYAGVRELHGLARSAALGSVGATVLVWLVAAFGVSVQII